MDGRPVNIAILALGGQGGGVLAEWIVGLAESQGWHAQSTSVPGVAQRTGATLYYIELLKPIAGLTPVFALMPAPGDVDIVIAAEWMEAGRAILRGLVSPDRTTLIASTHRTLAVVEKETPGSITGNSQTVRMAAETAAKRIVAFDMDEIAQRKGTAISAPLFGALAGSGALPFPAEYFRAQISSFGKSVERSLQAFEEAMKHGATPAPLHPAPLVEKFFPPMPEQTGTPELDRLLIRIRGEFPDIAWPMIFTGVCRLVDYQDAAYADSYLDRLSKLRRFDCSARDHIMTIAAARTISAAMSYDDVIRVADLKTRRSRFARIALAHGQETGDSIHIIESMHPGAAEIVGLLPARIGLWIEGKPRILTGLGWMFGGARQVKTSRLLWFAVLYAIGGLRRFRRGTFRHHREMHNIDAWLDQVLLHADNYDLAVQMLEARSLVKGYSDTLDRGLAKFNAIMGCVPALHNRPDGGEWIRRLIAAALAAESMEPLSGAIKTVQSLSAPGSEHSCQ